MPGNPVKLGPFKGGLHNSAGSGENIVDDEVFDLVNLEVDNDGSLANRPAIALFNTSGLSNTANLRVLGTYVPASGTQYLVLSSSTHTMIVDAVTGAQKVAVAIPSVAATQSANRMYIIAKPDSVGDTGGYFSVTTGTTIAWTAVAAVPAGEAIAVYKDRLYVASGIGSGISRLYYSRALDGTSWNNVAGDSASGGFVDVDPGNGQKLVYLTVLNNDIILFKEHSTYRYSFTSIPSKADVFKISPSIGVPAPSCAVTYDNNNAYVMHDNSVYELYNYTFTKISTNIALKQTVDLSLLSSELYGLTLFRDRLFVRYYSNLYVYGLKTQKWSRWESVRKFSRVISLPSASIGLDTAYAASSSSDNPGQLYYFKDDRVIGVGPGKLEAFSCRVVTKTYDFDIPHAFKVLMYWGVSLATSGNTQATVMVPNIGVNYTWDYLKANFTWDDGVNIPILWDSQSSIVYTKSVPPELGAYARKFIKLPKKLRFRQLNFTLNIQAVTNNVADACVRIWDITGFILQKEGVVKQTS